MVRAGLLAALAATADLLYRIQPSGSVAVTVWQLGSRLPVTLQADVTGTALAVMVLASALTVSLATSDRRALPSAALGLAAAGGVMAALAGGLLSLFIGLELAAVGGIGLSYARFPRAASRRILWAAVTDQAVALIWLGAAVAVYHQAGTTQFSDIPTSVVTIPVAGVLLLPVVIRLAGTGLIRGPGSSGSADDRIRAVDLADWLAVVAIPISLVLVLRVRQLTGGSWPGAGFGTILDAWGILFVVAAFVVLLGFLPGRAELPALLLGSVGLILVGFGSNTPTGAVLGIAAAGFVELAVLCLPRMLLGPPRGRAGGLGAPRRPVLVGVLAASAAVLPISFAFTIAVVGLSSSVVSGLPAGLAPALGYLLALLVLASVLARAGRWWVAMPGWSWPLILPALGLFTAALVPGWLLTGPVAAIASNGAAVNLPLTAPDPLLIQLPGLIWPVGYLSILVGVGVGAMAALRYAAGVSVLPSWAGPSQAEPLATGLRRRWWRMSPHPLWDRLRLAAEHGGKVVEMALAISEREIADRPVWLWAVTTIAVAWLLAQR